MEPFLWEGDVVQLSCGPSLPETGKLYSFSLDGVSLVAHRLKSHSQDLLVFQGDRQPQSETVTKGSAVLELARLLDRFAAPPPAQLLFGLAGLLARCEERRPIPNLTLHWPWAELIALAQKHRLLSVLGYALKQTALWNETPIETQCVLWQAMEQDIARAENISRVAEEIRLVLPQARFLKGTEMRSLYPEDFLRTMNDVDVLVPENLYLESLAILEKNGFSWNPENREKSRFYHQASVDHLETGIQVEVHSTLFQPHRYRFDSQPFLHAQEDREDMVAYLCAHAVSHWGRHGLSVLDVHLLLERGGVDPKKLAASARRNGCLIATAFVLQGAYEWWNRDFREEVLAELSWSQRIRFRLASEFYLNRFDLEMLGTAKRFLQFLLADSSKQFLKLYFDPGRRRLSKELFPQKNSLS